jgi:hypothetical protein
MKKRILLLSASVLFLILFLAGTVFAQGSAANKEVKKVTMKGKIGYMERSGGYYIIGENPPSEVFIVNQNKKVLDKLKKSGETVTIEGHFTIGADHLMIEKINGKKY